MTPRRNNSNNAQKIPDTPTQADSKAKGNLTNFPIQIKPENNDSGKVHAPQGDLIKVLSDKLYCKEEAFIDLQTKMIKHFNIIKDFKVPTRSACPIIINFRDSGHCQCVDGWDLVQQAIVENSETIRCHVFYMDSFYLPAVGVFKLAMRSMPVGGICTHAEMILNVRICFRLIKGGSEIPKASGHGGKRKGPKFDNNFDQKIVELLVEHLGKPPKKIREYINHGADLPDETLDFLLEKCAGRRFFEAAQKNKTNAVAKLKQEKVEPDAISTQISDRMNGWYDEFNETGKITDEFKNTKLTTEETNKIPAEIKAPAKKKAPQTHKHWTGNTSSQEVLPPTKDQLYEEIGTIIEPFVQLQETEPDISEDLIRQVLSASKQLVLLSESMEHRLEMDQADSEREKVA